ncbi:flagellar biosynthesis regulatory protein FlaF [Aquimixticola soesokkakensis]|uniref:Flagellar biosynthesis regulatory protein FlaF n=1 Tax=Aquimixticola soesokkakensis TaxID=1519096 RepID=A0A1Y5RBQ5_9RHOB|nr:flagellar biosynthesis regulator FlaF [Aquimixticola soesokkakensis]SLN13744.1 flagellar biosynthesis regulatory protein FlaF [Aquimixticola soesokkakensis]
MNALDLARTAYGSAATPIKTSRAIEYDAFARITQKMSATQRTKDKDFPSFARALFDNRRLWTLLASDVSDPQNALSRDLRSQIFYLAEFTAAQTSKILKGHATVEPLIDINTSVMRGLSREGGAQ